MLNTKQMLQDGFTKEQIAIVVFYDRNGKKHFIAVDNLEDAKKYKSESDTIQLMTLLTKKVK